MAIVDPSVVDAMDGKTGQGSSSRTRTVNKLKLHCTWTGELSTYRGRYLGR